MTIGYHKVHFYRLSSHCLHALKRASERMQRRQHAMTQLPEDHFGSENIFHSCPNHNKASQLRLALL